MSKKPDILRVIEFQQLLLKFRDIHRMVYLPHQGNQQENDVEHSYMLAMTAWYLAKYFPKLDRDQVIRLALVHDLVEIHAGDTFAYADKASLTSKALRERQALKQLKKDLPDFAEAIKDIEKYEGGKSEEAKFVYALDKIMPAIMNYLDGGRVWQENNISLDRLHEEKMKKIPVSADVLDYYQQLRKLFEANKHLFPN